MRTLLKKHVYLTLTLISITILLSIIIVKWNNKNSVDSILLQIGDKKETLSKVLKGINNNFQSDSNKINNTKQLDNYINTKLYLSSSISSLFNDTKQFSIDKNSEFLSSLLFKFKTEKLTENKSFIKDCYEKNKDILIIDYVWLPDSLKAHSQKVRDLLEFGEDLEYFRNHTDFKKMLSSGALFYPKRLINGGTLNQEIQDIAYKLKENDVELIHTKSGIHILRLFKRHPNNNHRNIETEREKISKRIQKAKLEANKDYWCDPILFNKKVLINIDKLSFLDYYFKSMIDSTTSIKKGDEVIAKGFNGNKILYRDYLKFINNLSLNIQVLLLENKSRLRMSEIVLLEMLKDDILNGIDEKIKVYKEDLMVELLIKNKYISVIENLTNKESVISQISDWINDFIVTNTDKTSLYSLLLEESYNKNLETNKQVLDKKSRYEKLLNEKSLLQKYSVLNSNKTICINYSILDTFKIDKHLEKNIRTIANYGSWELTANMFLRYVNDLTLETKLELINPENCFMLIEYIAKKELPHANINKLIIDKTLFYSKRKFSIPHRSEEYIIPSKNDIIASYDSLNISTDDLLYMFFTLNSSDKQLLINEITREDMVTKLMRRLVLEKESKHCELNIQNLSSKIAGSNFNKNDLFFQLFGSDVKIEPKGLEGIYFNLALKKLMDKKLTETIDQQLDNKKLYLNFEIANQFEIEIDKSDYKEYFEPL